MPPRLLYLFMIRVFGWLMLLGRSQCSKDAATPVLDRDVTRDRVLRALASADIVHFAGHGRLSADNGFDTGITLADGDVPRAVDLLARPAYPRLVVLSGCETGVSEHRPGDELVGLVRALFLAGAGSLLVSRWRVNDASTRSLLYDFHRRCQSLALPYLVGAENDVTAADLVFAVVRRFTKFDIWLREHSRLGHCQYSWHYDSPTGQCSASSAGLPCSPAPTATRTPRSSSCATRSPCSSARPGRRSCPGPTERSCPRWPGCCQAATSASCT